jgi:5-methyltetrahydropteroyltriglutamate--homocysteine methyltransferase
MTIRADHIGSLLRPPELLKARADHAAGRIGADVLREAEDRAIAAVIAMQRDAGLDVVNDGEYRRVGWMGGFWDSVDGFEQHPVMRETRGRDGETAVETTHPVVARRLKRVRSTAQEEAAFLKRHAGMPFKITVPSPLVFTMSGWANGVSDKVYPTHADLAAHLAEIIRDDLVALLEGGVPYIQIDAPQYTHLHDDKIRERVRREGWDADQAVDEAIAADRACLAGLRAPGRTIGFHLCRGNILGRWLAEGGYEVYAEKLFNGLPVDRFLLEYDSPRAGDFAPLRFMPKGVDVVLGLVTTKEARVETRDELLRRIEEASRYVPVDRLALSPQCGFATQAQGNPVSWDIQRRKLEVIAETAREVWH